MEVEMMEVRNKGRINANWGKLGIEGEKCNLIVQVIRIVLDARCWESAWK